jgi:hypothetical protein
MLLRREHRVMRRLLELRVFTLGRQNDGGEVKYVFYYMQIIPQSKFL